jgi:iron complex outermembrane recepter protein
MKRTRPAGRLPAKHCVQRPSEAAVPRQTLLAVAVSTALVVTAAGTALARPPELEEIIVTATKRAESVMEVPIAIQALSGDFIREVNLNDVKDLVTFTPGVTGNSKDSFIDSVRVRGIVTNDFGNGGDPSIGMYKDGLYQGRTGSGVFSLFDIERAEILRGPQGFLFGRNSISGAMNVITKKPRVGETDGYVELDAGQRGVFEFEGGASATLSDSFAVRFAGQYMKEDGYVTNVATGHKFIDLDKKAARITGRYEKDNVEATLMFEYEDRDQSGTIYRATGKAGSYALLESIYGDLGLPSDPLEINVVEPINGIFDRGKIYSFGAEIDVDTSIGKFTSLTGYKDHDYSYAEAFSAVDLRIFDYEQYQSGNYFQQEFRLESDTSGPLDWYAGLSYYNEHIDTDFLGRQDEDIYCNVYWGDTCQGVFDYYNSSPYAYYLYYYFGTYTWTPSPTGYMEDWNRTLGRYNGWAAYVDFNYQLTSKVDVSLGLRYNDDTKKFTQESLTERNPSPVLGNRVQTGFFTTAPLSDKQNWSDTTYRFAVSYKPSDESLLYFSITSGYKQGGFNSFALSPVAPWGATVGPDEYKPAHFGPENSISYEIGYKGTLLDGHMQLTANVFDYEYKDLQSFCNTTTPVATVCNVGKLNGRGVEATMVAVISDNWQLNSGVSYFDSEAHDVQEFCSGGIRVFGTADACEGQSIPGTPKWTAFASIDADFPVANGGWFGNLTWSWEGERRSGWLPLTPASTTFPEGARMVDGFSLMQLTFGYKSAKKWTGALYVENLTDETYFDGGSTGGDPNNPYVQYDWGPGRPRTVGARFTYEFD